MVNWPPIEAISELIKQTLHTQGWPEIQRRKGQRILTIDLYSTIPTGPQQSDLKIILGDTTASLLGYKQNPDNPAEHEWNYIKKYDYSNPQFPNDLLQDTGSPHEALPPLDLPQPP
jgi:hypothetical protein